jgi:hypothetical protein
LSLKIIWIDQNYVPKNISIIQNTKSPFNSPFVKGGDRGILNRGIFDLFLFYLQKNL